MKPTTITFPVISFKRLETPHDDELGRSFLMVASVTAIAHQFDDWRERNLRDPNVNSAPAKAISQTLIEEPENFLYYNRGLTLLAERVTWSDADQTVTIEFSDPTQHGLLDGGHTYRVINNHVDALNSDEKNNCAAYVRLEVLEGITDPDRVVKVVLSRNRSLQVKDQSMAELENKFEPIKAALAGQPYAENIYYKEFELTSEDERKTIDIRDILSYLICFDIESFIKDNHPIMAYKSKQQVLEHYTKRYDEGQIQKYLPLLPKILELWDTIRLELPELLRQQTDKKFRKLKFSTILDIKPNQPPLTLDFIQKTTIYRIPSAYLYPLLAALRTLVQVDGTAVRWVYEPVAFFREFGMELARLLGICITDGYTLSKIGSSKNVWRLFYGHIENELLRRQLGDV